MDKTNQFYEKNKIEILGLTPDKFSLVNEVSENAPKTILSKRFFKYMEVIPTQYGRLIIKKIQSKDNSSTDNPESIHIVINS
jgi:hypothetical protein